MLPRASLVSGVRSCFPALVRGRRAPCSSRAVPSHSHLFRSVQTLSCQSSSVERLSPPIFGFAAASIRASLRCCFACSRLAPFSVAVFPSVSRSFTLASSACCSRHGDCCIFSASLLLPPFVASKLCRFRFLMSHLLGVWGSFPNLADSVVAAGPEPLAQFLRVASLVLLTWLVNYKDLPSRGGSSYSDTVTLRPHMFSVPYAGRTVQTARHPMLFA